MTVAGFGEVIMTARLVRELDERECQRRNALATTAPGFTLTSGDVGTVLETFGRREAFLVEFSESAKKPSDACDWLRVLYPGEVEVGGGERRTNGKGVEQAS